ncbi:Hypothetical predicted protein [Paramuricea clavata]|uniref:Uncharacterized protein n=1 Tax=Paramuricea clavata TaxID=317549 RepID=A0A6S7GJP4_PARCT|nr:Hypothetical predicted protein [Paramuricea clavata]
MCYSNFDSCLKFTTPDQLAAYSNKVLCKEVSMECPIYNAVVTCACKASSSCNEIATTNAIALPTSAIAKVVNPTMSAVAYRISTVLFHSGISHVDVQHLNRLGICMSSDSVINLHKRMGENFDYAAKKWKKEIEENNSTLLFVREIEGKMLNRSNDMHLDTTLNLDEDSLKALKYCTPEVYDRTLPLLESERQRLGEDTLNESCFNGSESKIAKCKTSNIQTKDHNNLSIHWTHQYAVRDKVVNPTLETSSPQVDPDDLQLSAILPDRGVQQNMVHQWAVFVSRIVTKYIPAFQNFQKDVIWHIPHEFSNEMSVKSDMQYMVTNCLRNVDAMLSGHSEMGESEYDRLEGLLSEHAKVTLYKVGDVEVFVAY